MLTWPKLGVSVHTAVWVPEEDRAFAARLARYCARNPVALERLTYDRAAKAVTYRSDKSEGPTAGTETTDPLEAHERVSGHAAARQSVLTRSVIAPYTRRIVDPPRLKFLSPVRTVTTMWRRRTQGN